MNLNNLKLIGTSHIAQQSIKEVTEAIEEDKPDIVAVELDKRRLYSLFHKKKDDKIRVYDIKRIGFKGFLFSLLGAWAERKLGKMVGVSPGDEMKHAIKLAKKHNCKLALIDQDIEITLKRFSKALTWKEKGRFVADIVKAAFGIGEKIAFDLSKVPSKKMIKKMISQVKTRYPNVYKVLIEERNEVMAKQLRTIMQHNPEKKIVAVVGAGHEEDIMKLLKKQDGNVVYSYSVTV